MKQKAFQDYYPETFSHCYGCGKSNVRGHQLKSYWDGNSTVAYFTPESYYTGGVPENIYGGLIASLLDCHGTATAAAAAFRAEGRAMDTEPAIRFVTASLKVDFIRPTPMGAELEVRGEIVETRPRKVTLELSLGARGETCAQGRMIAVRLRDDSGRQAP